MNRRSSPREGPLIRNSRFDWMKFKKWLNQRYRPKTVISRFNYARKYADLLISGDLSDLQLMSDDKRVHVLKALSALSKFLGCHDYFSGLVKNYGLKWSSKTGSDLLIERMLKASNQEGIIEWIMEVKEVAREYSVFLDFMACTGLRYSEAVFSWNLMIQLEREDRLQEYYRSENSVLEHFRFKDLFLRNSKKTFISFVFDSLVKEAAGSREISFSVLPSRLKRRGLKSRFSDIREYHASYLTKYLRPPEIDFLHGRISTGIFMRNYFNPAWITDLKERALRAAEEILGKIA